MSETLTTEFGSTALSESASTTSLAELTKAFSQGNDNFIANLADLTDDPAKYIQPGTAPIVLGEPVLTKATIAGLNVMFFYTRVFRRLEAFSLENVAPPLAARLVGGVSLASWVGVMSAGRLLTFFRP